MTTRFLLAALAYIVPTFPLGYLWHLVIFKNYYASLLVYRPDMAFSLGVTSMAIQSVIWAYLYSRLFSGEPVLRGAVKFSGLAFPLAWSFLVLPIGAKHLMADVQGFVLIETAFVAVQYLIVSPLIALAFSYQRTPQAAAA